MKWRDATPSSSTERTYVVVADERDEAFGMLTGFARQQSLSAAQLTAVGAFSHATIGWFDPDAKRYRPNEIDEQCELLSLVGDVATQDGTPTVHAHVVLGLADGSARGGHLLSAEVWPTLEVIVRESPTYLAKRFEPDVGLALIDLDR